MQSNDAFPNRPIFIVENREINQFLQKLKTENRFPRLKKILNKLKTVFKKIDILNKPDPDFQKIEFSNKPDPGFFDTLLTTQKNVHSRAVGGKAVTTRFLY